MRSASVDSSFPPLYRLFLLSRAADCNGAPLPHKWVVDAVARMQSTTGLLAWVNGSASNADASQVGAIMLRDSGEVRSLPARRLATGLISAARDNAPFASASTSSLVNGGGIATLAALADLRVSLSISVKARSLRLRALRTLRASLVRQSPGGPALAVWAMLHDASRLFPQDFHTPIQPSRNYLRRLAALELRDGMFPLAPMQTFGDPQLTAQALVLLRAGGVRAPYASALVGTERLHRSTHGGWAPSSQIQASPAETLSALSILAVLQKKPGSGRRHQGVFTWLRELQQAQRSTMPRNVLEGSSYLNQSFSVIAAARLLGAPRKQLEAAARRLSRIPSTGRSADDVPGLFWQTAAQSEAGLSPSVSPVAVQAATNTLMAPETLVQLRPAFLLQVAALRALANPSGRAELARLILHAVDQHRVATGGYATRPGMPADIFSTRAAIALYALFDRPVPDAPATVAFARRCLDPTGGFSALAQGTHQGLMTSLDSTWSGLYVLSRLTAPARSEDREGNWTQRIFNIATNNIGTASRSHPGGVA
ncbi:MAG: hypothetical protein M3Z66_13495 [Chloroflexota bacterium]|nr:hypothetical protein [Chloroflexota bacterium]